jgi:hypothetical protein
VKVNQQLTDKDIKDIGFMCACYLDDSAKEIKRAEKQGQDMTFAKQNHSQKTRLVYTKIIPKSLAGNLTLLDGTVLKKEQS